ncbi:ABC transporter permease subunit [Haloechinothrix sp. LS1_15]|uniref:PhnE/PtxC family ABC transporter permease n=1 Tax=Haloechinothrix sp. LS1_15 TaxID=2652248 RepID=UPI002945E8C4|nr:ABC transporter permease subunit [Haloechinothrix sp. LS1_15]MDV6012880.1 ABC transporter permease subunit [Haloechinothrix sp. LS1_15]
MTVSLRALDGVESVDGDARRRFGGRPERSGGARRSRQRRLWILVVVAATIGSLAVAGVGDRAVVRAEGLPAFGEFFAAALAPRADAEFLTLTATAALTTLAYAVLGTALSLVIGVVGGVLTSQTWWSLGPRSHGKRGTVYWALARAVMVVPRGIHEVVWGLIFLIVFGLDPMVAVLAIGIPFGAVTAKVFSELLDETARQPYSALLAAGAGRSAAILYGLLPPAMSDLLSYAFYRFECAIRSAAVLGLVGAGGLGFQLSLSFQSLRYEEIWTLLYALIVLCVAADFWSSRVRARRTQRVGGARTGGRYRHDPFLVGSCLFGLVLIALSVWWIGLDLAVLFSGETWDYLRQLATGAWPPALGEAGAGGLLELSMVTLAMSILAMVIGFWGGAALAFPAAHLPRGGYTAGGAAARAGRLLIFAASRLLLVVLRAIPPPVWALLFLFVLYPGILPGALALGVYTAGVLGRLMAEVAENLDERPLHALRAQGAPAPLVFCYGVVPSATPRFIAYGLYRWEVTIRETVVVGVVGAGGLGYALAQQLNGFDYAGALTTLLVLILLTLAVDFTSAAVRRTVR